MKRIVIILLAGAALLACSRETEFVPDSLQERFSMTVTADDAATKTEVAPDGEGGYAVSWLAGDQLAVYEVGNGVVQERALSTPLAAGGSTASFEFSLTGTPDGPYDYTFVYPASALGMVSAHYAVTIPQAQSFGTSSFDPSADVLVSRHVHQDVRPSSVSASFARLGGTVLMTIKAPVTDETVRKIIFSTTEANLAGSYELDPVTGEVADVMLEGTKSLTLTPAAATAFSGNFQVWFRLAEVNLTGSFTVSVTTDKKTYTKTLYLSSLGRNLQFQNGLLTRFALDMTGVSGVDVIQTDVINSAFTGVGTTSYISWSGKKGSVSSAVYAGHSATRDPGGAIGLRSSQTYTGEYSGIVSTSSGGDVRAVTITATSTTSASRTVDVYVKNTPYASPNDLYEDSTAGDLIGSVTTPGSTETTETVTIPAGYSYVGIRSRANAVDIPEISITWEGAPVPLVSTGEASAITSAGATLSGSFTSAPGGIYEAGFYWDTDASDLTALAHPGQVVTTDGTAATSGSFSCPLGSLNEVTEYYYRAYVLWLNPETNTYEEYLGPVCSFTTIARDYSSALWLEMPAYSVSGMAGTTTSPLNDLYCISHSADMGGVQQRNYTFLYDPAMYTSYWVAYPLCSDHLGSGRDDQWGLFDPKMPWEKQVKLNRGYGVDKATLTYPVDIKSPMPTATGWPPCRSKPISPPTLPRSSRTASTAVSGWIWKELSEAPSMPAILYT